MKSPRQTVRSHNRTVTRTPVQFAQALEANAEFHLRQIVAFYRAAPPEVQALLLARPAVATALAWASSHAPEQARK